MIKLTQILFLLWLMILTIESPIRYVFNLSGIQQLIYIKDLLIIILLLIGMIIFLKNGKISKRFLSLLFVLVIGVLIGIINGLGILQVIFGIKIFMPLLSGFIFTYHLKNIEKFFVRIFRTFTPIILLGLTLDYFISLPWQGLSYSIGDYNIEGNREWYTFGIERIAGFQRTSFDSAILMFFLLIMYIVSNYKINSNQGKIFWKFYDVFLIICIFIGVFITTTKSAYFALTALTIFLMLHIMTQRFYKFKVLIRIFLLILYFMTVLPPVYSILVNNVSISVKENSSFITDFLLLSYLDRIYNTWPNSFQLLFNSPTVIFGRGIGGIGVSQKFFEPLLYNVADNLFVYMLVTFGSIGLLIFILLLMWIIKLPKSNYTSLLFSILLLTLFTFGATLNFIESSTLLISVGLLLGMSIENKLLNNL